MSFTASALLLKSTTFHPELDALKQRSTHYSANISKEFTVDQCIIDDDSALDTLKAAAVSVGDNKVIKAIDFIRESRSGDFSKSIPNFKAFQSVLTLFLEANLIDGWVYSRDGHGHLYPELVTDISFYNPHETNHRLTSRDYPYVQMRTVALTFNDSGDRLYEKSKVRVFAPSDVIRKKIDVAFANVGLIKETPEIKAEYMASLSRFKDMIADQFAKQFRVTGAAINKSKLNNLENRKVIHNMKLLDSDKNTKFFDSVLFDKSGEEGGVGSIPLHPVVYVFDIAMHDYYWIHSDCMTPYEYDNTLRDKLVLPDSHRDLLDILTTNLDAFVGDFIEGKSAGNVILCKGIAGVGKTLTAEVYAEIIEKPMISVHTGNLGTNAQDVKKGLTELFDMSRKWDCILLLDESDVFVVKRGENIEQNAIVAEFLRVLEYFDGLLFMTTNRADDIDEAIISRCAAIIEYKAPTAHHARLIWKVMAEQNKTPLADTLIDDLIDTFPQIAPRDIKMLFRLALRVSLGRGVPLTIDTFRQCAMFRAINMKTTP